MDNIGIPFFDKNPSEYFSDFIELLESSIEVAKNHGIDVSLEERQLQVFKTQIPILHDFFQVYISKAKELEVISYDVLFKCLPKLARESDYAKYTELTNQPIQPIKAPDIGSKAALKEKNVLLRSTFNIVLKDWPINKLFEYLIKYGYLDRKVSDSSFKKLFNLEAIPKADRLIWSDKTTKGKTSSSTVCRLVYELFFQKQTFVTHGRPKLSLLVLEYFRTPTGEFNAGTIDSLLSKCKREDPILNPREKQLERIAKILASRYS